MEARDEYGCMIILNVVFRLFFQRYLSRGRGLVLNAIGAGR